MPNLKKYSLITIAYIAVAFICLYFINRKVTGEYTMWLYVQLFNNVSFKFQNIIAIIIIAFGMILLIYRAGVHIKFRYLGGITVIVCALMLRVPIDIVALAIDAEGPIWIFPLQRFCCNMLYGILLIITALALTKGFSFRESKYYNKYIILFIIIGLLTAIAYAVFVWRIYRVDQFAVRYVNEAIAIGDLIAGYFPQDYYDIYSGILSRRLLLGCYIASFLELTCSVLIYLKLCHMNSLK